MAEKGKSWGEYSTRHVTVRAVRSAQGKWVVDHSRPMSAKTVRTEKRGVFEIDTRQNKTVSVKASFGTVIEREHVKK